MKSLRRGWRRQVFVVGVLMAIVAAAMPAAARDWLGGPSIYDEKGERDWGVEVIPYLWLSGLSGNVSLPAGTGTIPVSASFNELASDLDAGFAGLIDVRFRRWHLVSDNFWVRLSTTQSIELPGPLPPSASVQTSVEMDTAFGTLAAAYELPLGRSFALDLYTGARWWYVANQTRFTPQRIGIGTPPTFGGSFSDSWWDGVVGLRWRLPITESWRVTAHGDVGAGAADLDWSVGGDVGYYFDDAVGLTVGYRVVGVDYRNGGFLFDVRMDGVLLGLNLRY